MARTKEFIEEDVLERALDLFWRQGYEATSIRDLTAELGISSSSLYASFGDKRAIFLQALAHYREQELVAVRAQLANDGPYLETLRRFLAPVIETARAGNDRGTSFTLSAAVELGHDPAVIAQLREHLADLSDILAEYLFAGQAHGEIDDRFAPDDLARYFLHGLHSLGMAAGVYPERHQLERMATVILAVFEPEPGLAVSRRTY